MVDITFMKKTENKSRITQYRFAIGNSKTRNWEVDNLKEFSLDSGVEGINPEEIAMLEPF